MILKYPEVKDYIFKYNLLPGDVCDSIVNRLEKRNKWEPHGWYDAVTKSEDTLSLIHISEPTRQP